jgi:hypothetical protein
LVVSSLDLFATVNVAAAPAGLAHIIGAVLDAIVTAVDVFNNSIEGHAPPLLGSRILVRLLLRANPGNIIRKRAQKRVQWVEIIAKRRPDETVLLANVVLVATQVIKRLEDVAGQFGKLGVAFRVIVIQVTERRLPQSLVRTTGSSVSGNQDGSKKESKVQGNDLHGGSLVRVVDVSVGDCMSREIVRRRWGRMDWNWTETA